MPLGMSYKPPGPPPPAASCYICLEHSTDRKPLLRNCACRGDAGWAHVACLAEFAASKITEAQRNKDHSIINISLWENCILCKTAHMQYMGLAMAEAFVKQYEHLPDTDELRYFSLYSLASRTFNLGDSDGTVELCNRLLEMCDFQTGKGIDVQKGCVFGLMGAAFFKKHQFNEALHVFERQRDFFVDVYGPNSPLVKESKKMIVVTKERVRIGVYGHQKKENTAAVLVRARERFMENQECVDIRERLVIHKRLVQALSDDGRHQESMEQLEKLVVESRQSLGPDHPDTLKFETDAAKFRHLIALNSSAASEKVGVWAVIDCVVQQPAIRGQRVQVLRATKDAQKYVCLIKNDKGVSTKFKVAQHQFILEVGTTVVVHGLVSSTDLNGSIGIIRSFEKEKQRYAVSMKTKKAPVSIKPINLNIVFT